MEHTLVGYPYQTNGSVTALYSRYKSTLLYPAPPGTYFSHSSGTNAFLNGPPNISGFRARVWASNTNLITGAYAGDGQFFIGIVNSGVSSNNISLGNTNYVWPTPLSTNTTYTIVTRYVLATGASTLWVNPSVEGSPSVTDTNVLPSEPLTAAPTNGVLAIDCYGFRQASGGPTVLIDGLRIGTIFPMRRKQPVPRHFFCRKPSHSGKRQYRPDPFTVEHPETVLAISRLPLSRATRPWCQTEAQILSLEVRGARPAPSHISPAGQVCRALRPSP